MPSTRACALKHTWRCSGDSRSVAWKSLEQAMDFWGLFRSAHSLICTGLRLPFPTKYTGAARGGSSHTSLSDLCGRAGVVNEPASQPCISGELQSAAMTTGHRMALRKIVRRGPSSCHDRFEPHIAREIWLTTPLVAPPLHLAGRLDSCIRHINVILWLPGFPLARTCPPDSSTPTL